VDPNTLNGGDWRRHVVNPANRAARDSASLLSIWDQWVEGRVRTGDTTACVITKCYFKGRFSMEVSGVTQEACAAIHGLNAPILVAMSAKDPDTGQRAHVKILEGRIQTAMAVAAMREVLKGHNLDRLSQDILQFDRNLVAFETLQDQIRLKEDLMAKAAKNPAKAAQIQSQIDDLKQELAVAEAKLELSKIRFTDVSQPDFADGR
jgi:hypothetical protein